jgi:hypothetical protein
MRQISTKGIPLPFIFPPHHPPFWVIRSHHIDDNGRSTSSNSHIYPQEPLLLLPPATELYTTHSLMRSLLETGSKGVSLVIYRAFKLTVDFNVVFWPILSLKASGRSPVPQEPLLLLPPATEQVSTPSLRRSPLALCSKGASFVIYKAFKLVDKGHGHGGRTV